MVMRPKEEHELLSPTEQCEFCSGVGMLLFLVKHSRPDLANPTRELAKVMDGGTKDHQKELYRVIKYVLDTKKDALHLRPKEATLNDMWELKAYSDSDFSGDKDFRRSVTGFIVYLMGVPISWKSKGQKSVSLSSTEAEYVAVSEVCMEIIYIKQVLEFLGVKVKKPISVHVDNVGAIYLATNSTTSSRTRHIDTRYHFVREYVEDGVVEIVFVRSTENTADMFTKNVNKELLEKHSKDFLRSMSLEKEEKENEKESRMMKEQEEKEEDEEDNETD